MKSRTFLILCIVAALLGGVAYLTVSPRTGDDAASRLGRPLFKNLPQGEITSLTVQSAAAAVTLRRAEKGWGVEQRNGFPADFTKISKLVEKVGSLKIGRQLALSDAVRGDLALFPPDAAEYPADQRSTRIILANSGGKAVADLFVGKARDGSASGSGGQYLYQAGETMAYLVDQAFTTLAAAPGGWIRQQVVDISSEEVRQVDCLAADGETLLYTAARPARGEAPVLRGQAGVEMSRPVKSSAVETLFDALSSLRVEDVADTADNRFAKKGDRRFRYHLYDGRVFSVDPATLAEGGDGGHHLRLSVAFTEPHGDSAAPPDKGTETAETDKAETVDTDTTARENESLKPWVYTIPKWTYDSFAASIETLLEPEPQPAASPDITG